MKKANSASILWQTDLGYQFLLNNCHISWKFQLIYFDWPISTDFDIYNKWNKGFCHDEMNWIPVNGQQNQLTNQFSIHTFD